MKKWVAIILTVLVLLAAAGGAGLYWFHNTRIVIDETVYLRDLTELDLSGAPVTELEKLRELTGLKTLNLWDTALTVEQYEFLRQALPGCRILWSVPFQNEFYSNEITRLRVTSLQAEDLRMLAYFPELKKLAAEGCRDYENLMALKKNRPDLEISYDVSIGGRSYRHDTTELVLENADIREVARLMPYLPLVNRVTFAGTAPDNDAIYDLMCAYPGVTFVWDFEVLGVRTNSLAEELILSEIPMESVEVVENALKYFYNLKRVEMCDCGIPSEEMDALWKRHPETRFVWSVQVGMCRLRTDVTVFMPYQFGYNGRLKLSDAHMAEMKYCVDLICLDMGHMGIKDYSFLEYMPGMKYLILADTEGTDFSALASLKELVFLELFMTSFDQAEVLTGLTKLEDLNLGHSGIRNVEPLMRMTWLKRLWMPGTRQVDSLDKIALRDALKDTITVFSGKSSTGSGWRESPNYYAMRDLLNMGYMTR